MKKRIIIAGFIFVIISISFASAAHSEYPAFSEPYFNINDNNVLSISDVLIYNTGYYSVNGNAWQQFTLNGNQYENYPFLLNNGQANLPSVLDSEGTHFVIIFSCDLVSGEWDCHGDGDISAKWQLMVIQNSGSGNPDYFCGDGDCNSGETFSNCPEDCTNVGSNLLAGMSKVDITPPPGRNLVGYGNSAGNTGSNDPLNARVLILQENGVTIAFVSLDLLMFSSERIVNQVKQQFGVDYVLFSSSHTHAGPSLRAMSSWMVGGSGEAHYDDPLLIEIENKVIAAIGEATNNLFPASISAGKSVLDNGYYFSYNRRRVLDNGSVFMWWENPEKIENLPVDNTVGVVRIEDNLGNTRAMMVNYACHPIHTPVWNTIFSADFPGAMSTYIENQLGQGSVVLFSQGASGDIGPYYAGSPGLDPFETIEMAGAELAQVALNTPTVKTSGSSIEVENIEMLFQNRWTQSINYEVGLATIVIHDFIAFVAAPGEFYIQHQIDLYENSPLPNTFLYGYTHTGVGIPFLMYLPTIQAASEGGYSADEATFLEIGAGEEIINKALSTIQGFVSS